MAIKASLFPRSLSSEARSYFRASLFFALASDELMAAVQLSPVMKEPNSYLFNYTHGGAPVAMIRRSRANLAAQRRWFAKRHPDAVLVSVAVDPITPILREVSLSGGPAWEALRAKASWEGMTLTAVIAEYGDPRQWVKAA